MISITRHYRAPRFLAAWISLLVLLVGLGVSTPGQPTPPSDAPTPAQMRANNWAQMPIEPLPGKSAETLLNGTSQLNSLSCNNGITADRRNIYSKTVYAYFVQNNPDWEIKVGSPCYPDDHTWLTDNNAQDVSPRLSFDANQVVFTSDRDGNDEIYITNTLGGSQQRLTAHSAIDTMATFSPDGLQIAFVSDRSGLPQIYSMLTDGSRLEQRTDLGLFALYPDWSPDGTKILFTVSDGEQGFLAIMNSDDGQLSALTNVIPLLGQARWSPSGTQIVFEFDTNRDGWIDLGSIAADGSGFRLLRTALSPHDL